MTISSKLAFPALSPIPLIVHSTCSAPFLTAAKLLATASPKSLWQCTDILALEIFGTFALMSAIKAPNSSGVVYPTVSGILIMLAPASMAVSMI